DVVGRIDSGLHIVRIKNVPTPRVQPTDGVPVTQPRYEADAIVAAFAVGAGQLLGHVIEFLDAGRSPLRVKARFVKIGFVPKQAANVRPPGNTVDRTPVRYLLQGTRDELSF